MSNEGPIRVTALRGHVTEDIYGKGTKSERVALFLNTADNRYLFRRKDGPAFDDQELKRYIGYTVECDGFLIGTTILAEKIKAIG